jgi:hypothetical protein
MIEVLRRWCCVETMAQTQDPRTQPAANLNQSTYTVKHSQTQYSLRHHG